MSKDNKVLQDNQSKPHVSEPVKTKIPELKTAVFNPTSILQHAAQAPQTLSPSEAQVLQRTIGNQALRRLTIQRKMTVGPVGDKYEQEADVVARQVVNKLHASPTQSTPAQTAQRQEEEEELQMKPLVQRQEEEELQMKPLPTISTLQRQEEEELQMKPLAQRQEEEEELQMKPLVQRQEEEELQAKGDPMLAGGELSGDVESSVQSAKSGGQPIADNIRGPMEQAFNADFSSVKVHTGTQSDTLNRSLSARAFTSGQDVFFRQGEYNPGNSAGQELLAHELTHVVQQNGNGIQRTPKFRHMQRRQQSNGISIIQRRFDKGTDFLDSTARNIPQLKTIADAMDEFNLYLDKKSTEPGVTGDAAGLLKLIERTIFAYIDSKNAAHEKLTDIPHYAALEALRKQAGKEHEDLVQTAVDEDRLPFDLRGMDPSESLSLVRLWYQIKEGTGKIKLVGDPANQKQIRSWLVKLLETPTGLLLLGYLNAGDPTEAITNIYLGQTKDQLPGGIEDTAKQKGKVLEDTGVSEAQPLGASGEINGPLDLEGNENPKDYLLATSSAEFRTALMEGKKGVFLGGKKYEFNKGTSVGAFVTAHEGESKNESAVHNQIMTPGWVTMGHELGHAAHMKGGGTTMLGASIMENLTGDDPEKLNTKWQNSEEYLTINNWENSLRGDVGLTARDSHIPYTAGKKVERYFSIWSDVKTTFKDAAYFEIPLLSTFKKDLRTAFNSKDPLVNLENNGVYQALQQRWLILRATDFDNAAKQVKKDRIKNQYDEMNKMYNRKLPLYTNKWFPSKAKKTEWGSLIQERTQIVGIYQNDLDAHIDLNLDPATSKFSKLSNRIDAADKGFWNFTI